MALSFVEASDLGHLGAGPFIGLVEPAMVIRSIKAVIHVEHLGPVGSNDHQYIACWKGAGPARGGMAIRSCIPSSRYGWRAMTATRHPNGRCTPDHRSTRPLLLLRFPGPEPGGDAHAVLEVAGAGLADHLLVIIGLVALHHDAADDHFVAFGITLLGHTLRVLVGEFSTVVIAEGALLIHRHVLQLFLGGHTGILRTVGQLPLVAHILLFFRDHTIGPIPGGGVALGGECRSSFP